MRSGGTKLVDNISAVIPTHDRRDLVGRAIESVLSQNPAPAQIVVIDDGSTDGTADMIRSRFGSRVQLVEQPNGGNAVARMRGAIEAKGEWVAYLDDDDEWTPCRMARLLDAAFKVPDDVAWVFGDMDVVTDAGQVKDLFKEHGLNVHGDLEIFNDSLRVQYPYQFGHFQNSIIRRKAIIATDCFKPVLRSSVDVLAGFKIACRYRFAAIPFVVTRFWRTKNLRESSVALSGYNSPDYFLARIVSFSLAAEVDHTGSWRKLHQDAVRGYCLARAREGHVERLMSLQQFRYGGSWKSAAFVLASLFGLPGIAIWNTAKRWLCRRSTDAARTMEWV